MEQKLEDICSILNGYAFKSTDFDSAQKNKVIRMSDLKSGSISKEDHALVSNYVVAGLERFSLKHGDLLFGMSGSLSNYAWVTSEDLPAYLNQRVGCIRQNGDNIAQFVQYIYLSENTQKIISASAVGAAQLNISSAFLANIPVFIPHPAEQQKIGTYSISHAQMESATSALYLDYDQRRKAIEAQEADEQDEQQLEATLKALEQKIKHR